MKSNNEKLKKDIGSFIRSARVDKDLTGAELGLLLSVSQQQVSRYENGVTSISIENLGTILSVLEKSWDDFSKTVLFQDTMTQATSNNETVLLSTSSMSTYFK